MPQRRLWFSEIIMVTVLVVSTGVLSNLRRLQLAAAAAAFSGQLEAASFKRNSRARFSCGCASNNAPKEWFGWRTSSAASGKIGGGGGGGGVGWRGEGAASACLLLLSVWLALFACCSLVVGRPFSCRCCLPGFALPIAI